MRRKILLCLLIVTLVLQVPGQMFADEAKAERQGRDYYISSLNGDNKNDGTSENKSWETLDKLKEVKLQPGDRILLESGSVFNGFIHIRDAHGTADNPILLTSYGTGERPVINANDEGVWYQDYGKPIDNTGHKYKGYVSSTLLLYDCDFIEVSNLEITNQSDDWDFMSSKSEQLKNRMDRTGVAGIAQNGGTMEHIYLDNLYIHNIDGNLEDKHMNNGGIQFNVSKPVNEAETGIARYHDIKVTNNYVKEVSRAGIIVGYTYQFDKFTSAELNDETVKKYGHTDVLIEGNYVQNIGNDGIVAMYAYKPLVKSNVADTTGADLDDGYPGYWQSFNAGIWPWKTKDALFENNEVFDTVGEGNGDGQAWDIDYSDGTIYQYNYSHNNGGGAMLICLTDSVNGTFRYNISQNDLKALITFQGNPLAKIYNNVFYVDGDRATRVHHPDAGKRSGAGYIANNIFYNISTNNPNDEWNPNNNKTFTNNLYYGYTSTPSGDKNALTADPLFINPGSAPVDSSRVAHPSNSFEGYQVAANSPVVNAGTYIVNNTRVDFFNNPIGLVPDIGIHEVDGAELGMKEIFSDEYKVMDGRIVDVPIGTKVGEFLANIKKSAQTTVQVKNGSVVLTNDEVIPSGSKLIARFVDNTEKEFTIELMKVYSEYPLAGITASAGNSQPGEDATRVLDGNTGTIWHSSWNGAPLSDLWLSFDLQDVKPVSMLKYVPRQSGGTNGMFLKYSIYVKQNASDEWQKVATFGDTWARDNSTKYAYFDTVQARYIKLQAEEVATQEAPKLFGSAAEIRIGHEDGGTK